MAAARRRPPLIAMPGRDDAEGQARGTRRAGNWRYRLAALSPAALNWPLLAPKYSFGLLLSKSSRPLLLKTDPKR